MTRDLGLCLAFAAEVCFASRVVRPTIIDGSEVDPAQWKQVVKLSSGAGTCTATVVGPRVILTAGSCVLNGGNATFQLNGKTYTAKMTQSPMLATRDHDVALGLVGEEITGVSPSRLGGVPTQGTEVTLLGYGCTRPDSTGEDGKLRLGKSVITNVATMQFASSASGTPNKSLVCSADVGGPAFVAQGGRLDVVGVNFAVGVSQDGTITGPNHSARLDGTDPRSFVDKFVRDNGNAQICGINFDCGTITPPEDPSCDIVVTPPSVVIGGSVTLNLLSKNANFGQIDGVSVSVPAGSRVVTPDSTGTKTATGMVTGNGGKTASCSKTYVVTPKDPGALSCTLVATPRKVKPLESVTLELTATGPVETGSIDGVGVSVPSGKRIVSQKNPGDYSGVGFVKGGGAIANCYAEYRVEDGGPEPEIPIYAVVATYCGNDANSASTGIAKVCLGAVKKNPAMNHLGIAEAVTIRFSNGTEEVLPIIAKRPVAGQASKQELGLFANAVVAGNNGAAMDVRLATLTKKSDGSPGEIEGKTKGGKGFRATLTVQ